MMKAGDVSRTGSGNENGVTKTKVNRSARKSSHEKRKRQENDRSQRNRRHDIGGHANALIMKAAESTGNPRSSRQNRSRQVTIGPSQTGQAKQTG